MFYIILAGFLLVPALYQLLACVLHVGSFKMSGYIGAHQRRLRESKNPFQFLTTLSLPLARFMPISMAREIRLSNMLERSGTSENPKEYVSRLAVTFTFIAAFALPLLFLSKIAAMIILIGAILAVFIIHTETKDKSTQLQVLIEDEIPRMVESITHKLETKRNVIAAFDAYTQNYDTFLSRELSKTVADMRTGSPEIALQRFELRMNNPILSQFVRGVLATMRGENMTLYFNELIIKVSSMRKQRLTQLALKIKPKVSAMALLRAFWSIGVLLAVAVSGMQSMF